MSRFGVIRLAACALTFTLLAAQSMHPWTKGAEAHQAAGATYRGQLQSGGSVTLVVSGDGRAITSFEARDLDVSNLMCRASIPTLTVQPDDPIAINEAHIFINQGSFTGVGSGTLTFGSLTVRGWFSEPGKAIGFVNTPCGSDDWEATTDQSSIDDGRPPNTTTFVGTTSNGLPVTLVVRSDRTAVLEYSIGYALNDTDVVARPDSNPRCNGGLSVVTFVFAAGEFPLSEGQFTNTNDVEYLPRGAEQTDIARTMAGSVQEDSAEGTIEIAFPDQECRIPRMPVPAQTVVLTWTAARVTP